MEVRELEQWLWDAACRIRGPVDAPKFKDFILPLVFLKRLSDVYSDEVERLGYELGSRETAERLVESDHGLVRFYLPVEARWKTIASMTSGLGEAITDAVRAAARENPELHDVIDVVDFNATSSGQRIISDDHLAALVQALGKRALGIAEVEPDVLGRAYEYLLRKFAEPGASAGEFYTPREVGVLMEGILDPKPGMAAYDPCCGSAGLLIKCHLMLLETYADETNGHRQLPPSVAPLKLYGQEINPSTFAIAKMNALIHDMEADIKLGDTIRTPRFTEAGRLQQFDLVTANPMWNQDFPQNVFEHDGYERFELGNPPSSTADWGWLQHMINSLGERGRMAVVLDTGSVSRGSGSEGSNRERDIRKHFVDRDLIEAVVLLPENLFYNTAAPGIIVVINRAKRHPGELLLVNASKQFEKGRPKNRIAAEHAKILADLYHDWQQVKGLSAIVSTDDAVRNDYNLSPSRYIAVDGDDEVLPVEDAVILLLEAEEERAEAEKRLLEVLERLGVDGASRG